MPINQVNVRVDLSEISNGVIYFYVGPHGFPCTIDRLKDLLSGVEHEGNVDIEHILKNISINARIAGITRDQLASKLAQFKTLIESATFKV